MSARPALDALRAHARDCRETSRARGRLAALMDEMAGRIAELGFDPAMTWSDHGILFVHIDADRVDPDHLAGATAPAAPEEKPAPEPKYDRTPLRPWTEEEGQRLVAILSNGGDAQDAARELGRSVLSIKRKARRLGEQIAAARRQPRALRRAPPATAERVKTHLCAVPGCNAPLDLRNRTGVCRAHNHAEGHCRCKKCRARPGRAPRPQAAHCAVPGCGARLADANVTGVCRAHNHAKDYCRCKQCAAPAPAEAEKPRTPPSADITAPRAQGDDRPMEAIWLDRRLAQLCAQTGGWTAALYLRLATALARGDGIASAAKACGVEPADARSRWGQLRAAAQPDAPSDPMRLDSQERLLRALRAHAETREEDTIDA